ncbi:uncharacterized protein [Epargyreus clarus]|uniref:uncharacterized protein n=1 Tax=Epargyreus clarus TaxID=520877 RepID=UPI003C2B4663
MGDFNAKLGVQYGDELKVGPFGFGHRNHRGPLLANFLEKEGFYMVNSCFKKKPEEEVDLDEQTDKLERSCLMKTILRPTPCQIQGSEDFRLELDNRLDRCLEYCIDVDDINTKLVETAREVGSKYYQTASKRTT